MAYSYLSFAIIVFSAVTGLIAEGLCWLLVYRTASYRRLEQEIQKASRKVAEASGSYSGGKSKKTKQEQRKDDLMKASAGEIFRFQMKTALIVFVLFAGPALNHCYRWVCHCCCSTTYSLNCETIVPESRSEDTVFAALMVFLWQSCHLKPQAS